MAVLCNEVFLFRRCYFKDIELYHMIRKKQLQYYFNKPILDYSGYNFDKI